MLVGSIDGCVREFQLIKTAYFVDRVVTLKFRIDAVKIAQCCGGCAVLADFRTWIDIDAKIFRCLLGILGALDGSKWSLDLDVLTFLLHMSMFGNA